MSKSSLVKTKKTWTLDEKDKDSRTVMAHRLERIIEQIKASAA